MPHRSAGKINGAGTHSSPSSSMDTLDLALILDDDEPQLILSESPSYYSFLTLADSDDDEIPPCPLRPKLIPPFLALRSYTLADNLPLSVDKGSSVTVSIPTPSRLSRSLWEPVFIERWVKTHLDLGGEPPDDVPWAGPKMTKPHVWRPAGSLYAPSDFRKALQLAKSTEIPSTPLTFGIYDKALNREHPIIGQPCQRVTILSTEPAITLGSTISKYSVDHPYPITIVPEVAGIMADLQSLSSFFRDGLEDLENSAILLERDKRQPPTSSTTSIEPCCHISPMSPKACSGCERTVPLAARRGKNSLPPLRIHSVPRVDEVYPGIPTAFIGSSTAYTPKFDLANNKNDLSLSLDEMVASLRSKCAFTSQSPRHSSELSIESPVSAMSFATPSDQIDDEDSEDWAFATTLLNEYGTRPSEIMPHFDGDCNDVPAGAPDNLSMITPPAKFAPTLGSVIAATSGVYTEDPEQRQTLHPESPRTPVPSTPLPPSPISTPGSTSSAKNVRGILKNNKSVRFASLPTKAGDAKVALAPQPPEDVLSPPELVNSPPASPLERPLRTRIVYRGSTIVADRSGTTILDLAPPVPRSKPPERAPRPPNSRPLSVLQPSHTTNTSFPRKQDFLVDIPVVRPANARHSVATGRKLTPLSLSRLPKVSDAQKENIKSYSSSGSKSLQARWTLNEMTLKRSALEPQPQNVSKSRMPVPLRNILTRFK